MATHMISHRLVTPQMVMWPQHSPFFQYNLEQLHSIKLVHLTRSPKRFNMEASLDFNEVKIDPSPSIRVLGLHVDTKLR